MQTAEQVVGMVKGIGRLQRNGGWPAAGVKKATDMRRHGGESRKLHTYR